MGETSDTAVPDLAAMTALVGHRFRGGTYRIEHWENFLFTEATAADQLPDDLAHPAHLFHVAINGAGTSIAELFALTASTDRPVGIAYYDWQWHQPLREDVAYSVGGSIIDFDRSERPGSPTRDTFTYHFEMADETGAPVATVRFAWHHWRTGGDTR